MSAYLSSVTTLSFILWFSDCEPWNLSFILSIWSVSDSTCQGGGIYNSQLQYTEGGKFLFGHRNTYCGFINICWALNFVEFVGRATEIQQEGQDGPGSFP